MRMGFSVLFLLFGLTAQSAKVILREDEFILPALFNRIESHPEILPEGFNLDSANGKRRRAVPGEWFDYGDVLRLPASQAFQVIQNEHTAWIGGGVFRGKIGKYFITDSALVQSTIALERGWMKVWIKPGKVPSQIVIEANGDTYAARDAEFWINVRDGGTELYIVRGLVSSALCKRTFAGKLFVFLRPKAQAPVKVSQNWDPDAMEVHIAASYPALVKLADTTGSEWKKGTLEGVYSGYRRKGWRKAHRMTPLPRD